MAETSYQSWGGNPKVEQKAVKQYWRDDPLPLGAMGNRSFLPFGNGRSYGDVCLNDGGVVLDCRELDRFIRFDNVTGILRCEAGILLSEIHRLLVPMGWFLPVTPGTQFVTLGGAIANDVHGKNHHRAGTFGCHVLCFELLRSDGERLLCSPVGNPDYFNMTIGGLGLTGVITWAEIQLKRIKTPFIEQEIIRHRHLDEFFTLAKESDQTHEYTAAWIDCLAKGNKLGRGLLIRGNHAESIRGNPPKKPSKGIALPFSPPFSLINGWTLRLFNGLYKRKQLSAHTTSRVHFEPFLYPLDTVYSWNRIYGPRGFFQYQCAVPASSMEDGIKEILECIANAGAGSSLSVLKVFGDKPSPGILSFPMPGATLALDIPNRGEGTLRLLEQLDEITRDAGGRVNPSKDARMSARNFQRYFPDWIGLESLRDQRISSSFWRRVTMQ